MRSKKLSKEKLIFLYAKSQKSSAEIARQFSCSEQKVNYWLRKYGVQKRSISAASYIKHNPKGDPFIFKSPKKAKEYFLLGLGLGLYWGEGNKKNKTTVRLGNTDPKLIEYFIKFLSEIYEVKKEKFRFGLQIFSDMSPKEALLFWTKTLKVSKSQFGKIIVTPSRGIGTYREKTRHGVLTVYVSNTKLRNLICGQLENL